MNRRQFIELGTVGASLPAVSGCLGNDTDHEPEDDADQDSDVDPESIADDPDRDPEETTAAFMYAVYDGDTDIADALVHPEGQLVGQTETHIEDRQDVEVVSVNAEAVEQSDQSAVVRAYLTHPEEAEDQVEEWTSPLLCILQKEADEWHIFNAPSHILLGRRLEDVLPGKSYELKVGLSESDADVFTPVEDITRVNMRKEYRDEVLTHVSMIISEDRAEQIHEIAADYGDDFEQTKTFEYLDDELIAAYDMGAGVARSMVEGTWVEAANWRTSHEDEELAKRVAATIREHGNI